MQCTFSGCEEKATFHLSWIENRRCAKEQHLCAEHTRVTLTQYPPPAPEFSEKRHRLDGARQFEIFLVIISEINEQQVVHLREADGSRRIPILIGIFEAMSLARRLKGESYPRPLTHDAIAAAIRLLGGEVQDVVIDRLERHCYFANVRIWVQGDLRLLDVRPSDGFILAILFGCPIFFTDQVLDKIDQKGSIE